jgi:hypothetical protein
MPRLDQIGRGIMPFTVTFELSASRRRGRANGAAEFSTGWRDRDAVSPAAAVKISLYFVLNLYF